MGQILFMNSTVELNTSPNLMGRISSDSTTRSWGAILQGMPQAGVVDSGFIHVEQLLEFPINGVRPL